MFEFNVWMIERFRNGEYQWESSNGLPIMMKTEILAKHIEEITRRAGEDAGRVIEIYVSLDPI